MIVAAHHICFYIIDFQLNDKSEKTFRRNMYIEGFAKFLVIFVRRYIFTLVKINLGEKEKRKEKKNFMAISQKYNF